MAIRGPQYQSAGDYLSAVLSTVPASYRADRERRDKMYSKGITGLASAGGAVYSYQKRKRLTYAGDENLRKLEARRAEIEARLKQINDEIEKARMEEFESEPMPPQDGLHKGPDSYGHGPSMSEMSSFEMSGYEPAYMPEYEPSALSPEAQSKYKIKKYKSTGASGLI